MREEPGIRPLRSRTRSLQSSSWGRQWGLWRRRARGPGDERDLDTWIQAELVPDLPVQVWASRTHLAVVYDHELVDATVAAAFPHALVSVARGGEVPTAGTVTTRPLVLALRHTFGLRVDAWRGILQDARSRRRRGRAARTPEPQQATEAVSAADAGAHTRHLHTTLDLATVRELQRWGSVHGLGIGATLLLLAHASLERAGALRPRRTAPAPGGAVPRPARMRVLVSYVGTLRDYERLPWTAGPDERTALSTVHAAAVGDIGWTMFKMHGRLHVIATFRGDVVPPERVRAAADLMGTDAVAVLREAAEV